MRENALNCHDNSKNKEKSFPFMKCRPTTLKPVLPSMGNSCR